MVGRNACSEPTQNGGGLHFPMLCLPDLLMQSYPPRALDIRLQEDWARDSGEGPRVLMGLRVDFRPMGSV